MENIPVASSNEIEASDNVNNYIDIVDDFKNVPDVAKPLISSARRSFKKIEQMLYSAPAVINALKAAIPEESFQAILTDEQKSQLASGALKLMTKKTVRLWRILLIPKLRKLYQLYLWRK